jgi:hypothetical protein
MASKHPETLSFSDRLAIVLTCFGVAISLLLWLVPERSKPLTVIGLITLFGLLAFPVTYLPIVRNAAPGWSRNLSVLAAWLIMAAGITFLGIHVWPEEGLGMLDSHARELFIKIIKMEPKPIPVQIMCPPYDEPDCSVAGQFVSLFGEAGWPLVTQSVQRITPGIPMPGLYLVIHSTADIDYTKPEFQHPNVGVWTKFQPSRETVAKAFTQLGIKTGGEVGQAFPEDTLGIYFGPGTAKR